MLQKYWTGLLLYIKLRSEATGGW